MSADILIAIINGFFAIVSAWIGSSRSLPGLPNLPKIKEETLVKVVSLLGYFLLASFICFFLKLKYLLFLQCFLAAGILSIFLISYGLQNSFKKLALISSIVFIAIVLILLNIHMLEQVTKIKGSLVFDTQAPVLGIILFSTYIAAVSGLRKSLGLPIPKLFFLPLAMLGLMKKNNFQDTHGQNAQPPGQPDRKDRGGA